MKLFTVLAREKRLLLLGAVSALLHLAVFSSLGHDWLRARRQEPSPRLSVRIGALAGADTAKPEASPTPAAQAPSPRTEPAPIAKPAASADATTPQTAPAAPQSAWSGVPDGAQDAGRHMPGRQAVQVPPAATLTYAVTAGQPPAAAGSAQLDWKVTPFGYVMSMDGVTGALRSRGQMNDAGFSPIEAQELLGDGATPATTRFDWTRAEIAFSGAAGTRPISIDAQDRASMLMLLSGIGLADPSQIQDVIELYVAGSGAAGAVRFQVLGPEELSTAMGAITSIHLAQLAQPGQARLEVWLAPEHSWYPVQLRVTAPDGAVRTQQVTAIAPAQ